MQVLERQAGGHLALTGALPAAAVTSRVPPTRAVRAVDIAVCRALGLLLAALATAGSLITVATALSWIPSQMEVLHPEGAQLYVMSRVRDGLSPYVDPREYPYNLAAYTPLYYALVGLPARWFALGPDGMLALARALTVIGGVACAVLTASLGRRLGLSSRAACLAAALFGSSFVLHPWLYTARPDTIGLALTLGGLLVGIRQRSVAGAALAGVLLAGAVCTKQSFVTAPALLALHLVFNRAWERSLWLGLAAGLVLTVVLTAATAQAGVDVLSNVVATHTIPMSATLFQDHAIPVVALLLPLGILSALGWRRGLAWRDEEYLIQCYAVASVAIGLLGLAKPGSHFNYLLEASALLAVFAARACDSLIGGRLANVGQALPARVASRGPLVAACCLFAAVGGAFAFQTAWSLAGPQHADETLVAKIRATSGDVLTQADSLAVFRAGKVPLAADPLILSVLGYEARWGSGELVNRLATGQIGLVVLEAPADQELVSDEYPWWPLGVRETIAERYVLMERIGRYWLYAQADRPGA
ncbi:MAG: hypothetical protein U0821_16640 [Chloroflexota bacterium]